MVVDGTAIIFKVVLSLPKPSQTTFWTSKPIFQNFDPLIFLLWVYNLFFVSNFPSRPLEVVRVDLSLIHI